jgi:hypothetical protein
VLPTSVLHIQLLHCTLTSSYAASTAPIVYGSFGCALTKPWLAPFYRSVPLSLFSHLMETLIHCQSTSIVGGTPPLDLTVPGGQKSAPRYARYFSWTIVVTLLRFDRRPRRTRIRIRARPRRKVPTPTDTLPIHRQ